MIDFGFIVSSSVPLVLFGSLGDPRWLIPLFDLHIFDDNHLRAVWHLSLGLTVIPAPTL